MCSPASSLIFSFNSVKVSLEQLSWLRLLLPLTVVASSCQEQSMRIWKVHRADSPERSHSDS